MQFEENNTQKQSFYCLFSLNKQRDYLRFYTYRNVTIMMIVFKVHALPMQSGYVTHH